VYPPRLQEGHPRGAARCPASLIDYEQTEFTRAGGHLEPLDLIASPAFIVIKAAESSKTRRRFQADRLHLYQGHRLGPVMPSQPIIAPFFGLSIASNACLNFTHLFENEQGVKRCIAVWPLDCF
jgi:hypothetical protein